MNDKTNVVERKCPYVVRYEDIEFGEACDIMERKGGYFDADSRSLVIPTGDIDTKWRSPSSKT